MAEDIRFDVVIPAYNRGTTIGAALASVLAQEHPPQQIIVVDDGSVDDTVQTVRTIAPGARILQQANQGASVARNEGVQAARAPWVAFLDSDDTWEAGHLLRMARAIDRTAGMASFYFADTIPDSTPDRSLWQASGFRVDGPHLLVEDASPWVMMDLQPMMLQSSVFSRAGYAAAGGLRPQLRCRHDTHLFLLLGLGHPACAVAGCGARMTAADRSGMRLTEAFGHQTRQYWTETVALYEDILRRGSGLSRKDARELRARLCVAHLRLVDHFRREHRYATCLAHVLEAARRHPVRFAAGLYHRIRKLPTRVASATTRAGERS